MYSNQQFARYYLVIFTKPHNLKISTTLLEQNCALIRQGKDSAASEHCKLIKETNASHISSLPK